MIKRKELSDFEHEKIISLHKTENLERTILQRIGFGKITIHNIIKKYYEIGAKTVTSQSERSKILTEHDKHHLKIIVTQNRYELLAKVHEIFNESTENKISKRIVKCSLYELGYHSHTALRKLLISESNQKI